VYGKLFASMYDGTLYGHWQAIVTFQQMIVLCDGDGLIDMTPQAIAARTSIPLEIIQEGVKVLEQPDPYSRTPGDDGRRIVRLDDHRPWGWRIVNYHVYRDLVAAVDKRKADRERIAAKRAESRDVSHGVAERRIESRNVANVAHTEAEVEEEREGKPKRAKRASRVPRDFNPDVDLARSLLPDADVEAEVQKFRDWEFKTPRSDWPAVWRGWLQRCKERGEYARKAKEGPRGLKFAN
jgi:hypothetical protein